jgi:hypothetical protein
MNTVSDAVARPARTGLQGGAGWVVAEFIDAFLWDMDDRQYGIAVVVLGSVISWIQNTVENHYGKGLLRQVPEPDPPVVDDRGVVNWTVALLAAIVVLLVFIWLGVDLDKR